MISVIRQAFRPFRASIRQHYKIGPILNIIPFFEVWHLYLIYLKNLYALIEHLEFEPYVKPTIQLLKVAIFHYFGIVIQSCNIYIVTKDALKTGWVLFFHSLRLPRVGCQR